MYRMIILQIQINRYYENHITFTTSIKDPLSETSTFPYSPQLGLNTRGPRHKTCLMRTAVVTPTLVAEVNKLEGPGD